MARKKVRRTAPLLPIVIPVQPEPKPKAKSATKKPAARKTKKAQPKYWKRFQKFIKKPAFKQRYFAISGGVLFGTTLLWSLFGSLTQQNNADELANSYLLQDKQTFDGALLPGQHSFLFKFPLQLLVKFSGYTPFGIQLAAVLAVLITIGGLAYILWRIEKRPLVLGSLYLALASMLLMVPTQPYFGAQLPVSMAMLMTRNIEYLLYIIAVLIVIRPGKLKHYGGVVGVALLALLIASDHLFISLGAGAALLVGMYGLLIRRRQIVVLGARQFSLVLIATIVATGLTRVLERINILNIQNGGGVSPYMFTNTPTDAILGVWYSSMSFLTNLGANPIYDAVAIKQAPSKLFESVLSPGIVAYIINLMLVAIVVYAGYRLLTTKSKLKKKESPAAYQVSLVLIAAVIASFAMFIGSKHYYAVDARYLGIVPFAAIIVSAAWLRTRKLKAQHVVIIGLICAIGCVFGSVHTVLNYQAAHNAQKPFIDRNQKVIEALKSHHADVLVGDYWRTYPIKQASQSTVPILPLQDCTTPRAVLTSSAWNVDLRTKRFAYLLSLDQGQTDFPACSLADVTKAYGRPNSSTVISGTLSNPRELLLFYDSGSKPIADGGSNMVLPVELSSLGDMSCEKTILNIVAHQDDDLLFINPDTQRSISEGACVRTVYTTAGDSGSMESYWLAREQGSEDAYSAMLGGKVAWAQQVVQMTNGQYITIMQPKNNPKISLLYLRLPDGNLTGYGFEKTKQQSLSRLFRGDISTVQSVDGQSKFSANSLQNSLLAIMNVYKPQEVRTQSSLSGSEFTDHSDHQYVGAFAKRSFDKYALNNESQIVYYLGYPVREREPNVAGDDLSAKQRAFFAYGAHDGSVCQSVEQCDQIPTYGSYISRQYRVDQ